MKIVVALLVLGVLSRPAQAQEKPPNPNSTLDFLNRPLNDSIVALKDKDITIRHNACRALLKRTPLPPSILPELVKVLQDKDSDLRGEMASLLGYQRARARSAVPALRAALKDRLVRVRIMAAIALHSVDAREPILAVLLEGLEAGDKWDRRRAARGLADMPWKIAGAVEPLRKRLRDEDLTVRVQAARALWLIDRDPTASAVLLKIAQSSDTYARQYAIEYLGLPGLDGKSVLPILGAALQDQDWLIRSRAALALGTVDAEIEERVNLLLTAMKDRRVGVRQMAAQGLGLLGPAARRAVPLLAAALKDVDARLRSDALNALGAIGPGAAAAAPALGEMLRSKEDEDLQEALFTLLKIGSAARAALPAIRGMMEAPPAGFRSLVEATAWRVGDDAKARDLFLDILKNRDANMRRIAVTLVSEMDPSAKKAAPALRPLLRDADSEIRFYAARGLWRIAKDESAIPILIDLLQDKNARVRFKAAHELGEIGPAVRKAVPVLKRATSDEDRYVQRGAYEALAKIAPGKPRP